MFELWTLFEILCTTILISFLIYLQYRPRKRKEILRNDSTKATEKLEVMEEECAKWRRPCHLLQLYGESEVFAIENRFFNLRDVSDALRSAGLGTTNLIFGIDFTISNKHQGMRTFGGNSLHDTSHGNNPYMQVIRILGETLEPFDEDGIIPAFGFGDSTTKDFDAFPFNGANGNCVGFQGVLQAYNYWVQRVRLSGPTNFAPLIYKALEIVKATKQYHILVIVADGQVICEKATRSAIEVASMWPLSIIMIGVGDGPWEMMDTFDNDLKQRAFDNFQFVDFHKVTATAANPLSAFALHALMEIPDQYLAIQQLRLLEFND